MEPVVTAGLDGSAESHTAAHWAAVEAVRRGASLRLLHAWVLYAADGSGSPAEKERNYWAERIVEDAKNEIRQRHPDLPVTAHVTAEDPERALLRTGEESELLVLGSRGLDAVESFFLGDTALHVMARTVNPVVLVRAGERPEEPPPGAPEPRVVVGLDLRGPDDAVLRFAFEEAARRALPLYAVHGRSLHYSAPAGVAPQAREEVGNAVTEDLRTLLLPWTRKYPGVTVEAGARLVSPAKAVIQASRGADLLVLGRHRHRIAPRIGAVAHAAVHHAPCPVAVVPVA
ncbi:universal stress protein [Streptomyces sp. NPDC048845]|uniref:universal stress protein n=1 Tax=Streptomyces sp. NPDC048845 TaxID=3155390 RepID=UPI00343A0EFF